MLDRTQGIEKRAQVSGVARDSQQSEEDTFREAFFSEKIGGAKTSSEMQVQVLSILFAYNSKLEDRLWALKWLGERGKPNVRQVLLSIVHQASGKHVWGVIKLQDEELRVLRAAAKEALGVMEARLRAEQETTR
ncbi:MAG: hypothetical protein D6808_07335 [Candidatus Dadabacteria bacterium]|nr:MAG: hypothetical protein D6808_07335 [Candidatus Dadabacteria bacterium]